MEEESKGSVWASGVGCCVLAVVGVLQLITGIIGVNHVAGWIGIVVACAISSLFRIELPFMIGTFICAYSVWRWPLPLALLFAAPGLLFFLPDVVASLGGMLGGLRASRSDSARQSTHQRSFSGKDIKPLSPVASFLRDRNSALPPSKSDVISPSVIVSQTRSYAYSEDSRGISAWSSIKKFAIAILTLVVMAIFGAIGREISRKTISPFIQSSPVTKPAKPKPSPARQGATPRSSPKETAPPFVMQKPQELPPIIRAVMIGDTTIRVPQPSGTEVMMKDVEGEEGERAHYGFLRVDEIRQVAISYAFSDFVDTEHLEFTKEDLVILRNVLRAKIESPTKDHDIARHSPKNEIASKYASSGKMVILEDDDERFTDSYLGTFSSGKFTIPVNTVESFLTINSKLVRLAVTYGAESGINSQSGLPEMKEWREQILAANPQPLADVGQANNNKPQDAGLPATAGAKNVLVLPDETLIVPEIDRPAERQIDRQYYPLDQGLLDELVKFD